MAQHQGCAVSTIAVDFRINRAMRHQLKVNAIRQCCIAVSKLAAQSILVFGYPKMLA